MKYAYLYLPGIILIALPIIKAFVDVHKANVAEKAKIAKKEAHEAARREALRKAKEEREAAKAAEEAAKAAMPKRRPGRPRKNPVPEQRPETISPAAPAPIHVPVPPQPVTYCGNNAFAGHVVAFTGTLPGMTRREAIEAVQKNGGKAFDSMPAATTLLVVGDRPGTRKQDKADEWQSCRKITAQQFFTMLQMPLTLDPDAFASFFRSQLANNNA